MCLQFVSVIRNIFENVSWLAFQDFTYLPKGRKSNTFHFPRPKQRQVLLGNTNLARKFFAPDFSFSEHDIEVDDNRHGSALHELFVFAFQLARLDQQITQHPENHREANHGKLIAAYGNREHSLPHGMIHR